MITVKDIREKDFSLQKRGYSEDEVDDFLDAIADQLGSLIRENRDYLARAEQAEQQRDQAYDKLNKIEVEKSETASIITIAEQKPEDQAPVETQAKPVDESAYFDNLKTALREALVSAQHIAEQTVSEAKKKALDIVNEAEGYATQLKKDADSETAKTKAEIESEVENMKSQLETLKSDAKTYREKFMDMIKSQLKALGEEDADK